jgi:di/tricarboxylate transporter
VGDFSKTDQDDRFRNFSLHEMTLDIFLILVTIVISLVLFSFDRLPADVIALGVLLFISITGLLPPDKAFAGFGSDAVILIMGLLILTAALIRTGVVDIIGREITRFTGNGSFRLLVVVMGASALVSSLISNTAATAIFLPVVIGIAHRAKMSTSKLLMPLAFATILSSSVTLVATSTNIVVSGLMTQHGMSPIGMFELAPVGLPILVIGILYMLFWGYKLIPERGDVESEFEEIGKPPYLAEVIILPGSALANKTLAESGLGRDLDLTVVRVEREKQRYFAPQADLYLKENDVLLVEGSRDDILKVKEVAGIDFLDNIQLSDPDVQSEEIRLVEAIILLRSPLLGRTLRGAQFREKYGLQVLAINRHGETIRRRISRMTIQLGDVLLIQGHRSNIVALESDKTFRLIGPINEKNPNLRRAPIAVGAFAGALALATFNLTSFPLAVLIGVLVVFVTRCITPEEAYREVEWRAIILIGSMLGVGAALEYTGAAQYFAYQIVSWSKGAHPLLLLSAFFILTMLLTQPMSNQAAAAIVVPIALQTAAQIGANPRTFAVMIAIAASCSFLTPLEPACLMVYGPGRYRFVDFLKVGSILTVAIFLVAILLVPVFWPL